MATQPIGISFIPSAANQNPGQAGAEGAMPGGSGSSDLAQAYKVLSLRLPQVLGAQAPTPGANLTAPGATGVTGLSGVNPYAALFAAMLRAQLGLGGSMGGGMDLGMPGGLPSGGGLPSAGAPPSSPRPKVTLGDGGQSVPDTPPAAQPLPDTQSPWSSY